jgi:hypothetical protein
MTTCQRCNTENLDGSQYCDECGGALTSVQAIESLHRGAEPQSIDDTSGRVSGTGWNGNSKGVTGRETQIKAGGAAVAVAVHAKLVIERGRSAGKQFLLSEEESQIGRWDADGGIFPDVDLDSDDPEAKVSRRHARIVLRAGQYFIEDLGSTNGTFINRGRRLLPGDRQPLRDGDEIIVGKTFLRFHVL